ncbi:triphosphoribosyl-dephospho-CoA synthase MdcB [Sphingomonas albertensis]|uniref:Probable 2-(5''-triphosphoribosyl)-3'-dephosphocoenzyme-A synthase n=1 Tax=Sphingomonas albertensis TaxID=2762591 RepID=A0ABR7AIE6_9SPHN|nr:triphosphoribosyl-dephospho-CoA synthase MdcB [Sphingomonas albertensis]MBC3940225.1 triphosphoribosyl-dephospho-CoA synthase MdcB [Sphingomonas albertensis]
MTALARAATAIDSASIGRIATDCLKLEIATYPKPGLVSPVDTGAHDDMDAAMMNRSAETLEPFFARLADAGAAGAGMDRLRAIGIEAEVAMMAATGGVNTHRGAIFGMGLLCAAAGFRAAYRASGTLGEIVAHRWGAEIRRGPVALHSHGSTAARRHAAGGARAEAATGFPSLYDIALPALAEARLLTAEEEARRVHALIALIVGVEDTNLLYRGGTEGLAFAQSRARTFLASGSVAIPDWRARAVAMHEAFTAQRLSPGGCADLLAMALFVEARGA